MKCAVDVRVFVHLRVEPANVREQVPGRIFACRL